MYILDIKYNRIKYISATVFCIIFAAIYEYFSHGVYSNYMIFAFLIPLAGGIISEIFFRCAVNKRRRPTIAVQVLAGSVIWLTIGCLYQGVLEIYGTTNHLNVLFFWVGIVQFALSIVIYGLGSMKKMNGMA
ncbi:MAG: hypothetical protein E7282_04935 [Lachnospiraceae bacterium]|nr:hypothetical protein [Lachnospiraceae bacterium]